MSDLWSDIQSDMRLLDKSLAELRDRGQKLARAEADYQKAKATKAMELKADKMPVTLIEAAIKGMPEVNKFLYERIAAQTLYDCCREGIMSLKLQIKTNSEQYAREWGNTR